MVIYWTEWIWCTYISPFAAVSNTLFRSSESAFEMGIAGWMRFDLRYYSKSFYVYWTHNVAFLSFPFLSVCRLSFSSYSFFQNRPWSGYVFATLWLSLFRFVSLLWWILRLNSNENEWLIAVYQILFYCLTRVTFLMGFLWNSGFKLSYICGVDFYFMSWSTFHSNEFIFHHCESSRFLFMNGSYSLKSYPMWFAEMWVNRSIMSENRLPHLHRLLTFADICFLIRWFTDFSKSFSWCPHNIQPHICLNVLELLKLWNDGRKFVSFRNMLLTLELSILI